jgi:hypothetical protein
MPVRNRIVNAARRARDPGVRDHDVQAAEVLHDSGSLGFHFFEVLDGALVGFCSDFEVFCYGCGEGVGVFGPVEPERDLWGRWSALLQLH